MVANKNKHFIPNHRRRSQWSRNSESWSNILTFQRATPKSKLESCYFEDRE